LKETAIEPEPEKSVKNKGRGSTQLLKREGAALKKEGTEQVERPLRILAFDSAEQKAEGTRDGPDYAKTTGTTSNSKPKQATKEGKN